MDIDRRNMMIGGAGLGAGLAVAAGIRKANAQAAHGPGSSISAAQFGARPNTEKDQTAALQKAIDAAAKKGMVLDLPPGEYLVGNLSFKGGTMLHGVPDKSILKLAKSSGASLTAKDAKGIQLIGVAVDGIERAGGAKTQSLLAFDNVQDLVISGCHFRNSPGQCIALTKCSGRVSDTVITGAANTGIKCVDSKSLDVSHNHVHHCDNNGIQVWRTRQGEDGTIVMGNRVEAIGAVDGGSGQNGNGINVFRAGSVQVSHNRITDCVFSAIRGNAASDFLVTGNQCTRLGEVAIYAEFGFEGAVITNNIIDKAATGISVTNFNDGGRLAIVQGNLVRNLFMRGKERGVGIGVEADTMVCGNVVEGAPGGGIMVGWGRYLRDVNVTGNIVREARVGIGISASKGAGYAFVTNNMLSATAEGGIIAMDHDKPLGPDLAKTASEAFRNMAVYGNVSL